MAQYTEEIRDRFRELAISYNINIITGSMPYLKDDSLYNVGFLCRRDGSVDMYEKIHVTPDEQKCWALKRKPILHGYAVAFGLIPELYLSVAKTGFPTDKMRQTVTFIKENYGTLNITCDDYDELIELMQHDKKNQNGIINFTMLGSIGDIRINQTATTEEIKEALDFFREG